MPRSTLPPELERALVAAALRFRAAGPWRELANIDYLLVETAPGAFRVLTILGNGGSQFGLQAYSAACVGELLFLLDAWTDAPPDSPVRMLELLEGECLDLVPKSETEPEDRARLAAAGFKPAPRARHAWPVSRQFHPGCFSWRIDEDAARRLLADLDRALRWAELACRVEERAPDTPVALRWVRLELPAPRPTAPLPVDAAELAALSELPRKADEWQWIDERLQAARIQEPADELCLGAPASASTSRAAQASRIRPGWAPPRAPWAHPRTKPWRKRPRPAAAYRNNCARQTPPSRKPSPPGPRP